MKESTKEMKKETAERLGDGCGQRADNFRKRLKMPSAAKATKSVRKITKTCLFGLARNS